MALHWRETLQTLLAQFQAKAARSMGIYHMMVETSDDERDKQSGPSWFQSFPGKPKFINGEAVFERWDCSRTTGMPGVPPGFREPRPGEQFTDNEGVVRDLNGVVRAVHVPMTLRRSYYCGRPSSEVTEFESLANMASLTLADATDLREHFLASELCDLFRPPRGGVRYIFGEVPEVPKQFISRGWACGVLRSENGILIDAPISESKPDSSNWMLLLHRLGWRKPKGSPLTAHRAHWDANIEVSCEMLALDQPRYPAAVAQSLGKISRSSYYSVLGTKDSPVDAYLASAVAIQLLTSDMSSIEPVASVAMPHIDYTKQAWHKLECPPIKTEKMGALRQDQMPRIGIVVAVDVEKRALMMRMKPPRNRRHLVQIFKGSNTYIVGRLGVTDVVLVMTAMGSVGRDSSTIVTSELIDDWNPDAVIMVGIAFGKDAEKQMIGGVLISERVICYEPERLGKQETQARGAMFNAGSVLLNRFKNVGGWRFENPHGAPCSHQVGAVLSGEKLLDNAQRKASLFSKHPTAIGGEMEGAGFASAAERKKREWIIVKAICDWGDGTKQKDHQAFAAAASVDLLAHVLNQVGVLDALRD